MSSNCLVFHTSGRISSSPAAFLFLIFLRTELSFSLVNGPSLMSNCLLIILVIGSFVTFGGFPSRFSKCCFHSFTLSCWFATFNFALAVITSLNDQIALSLKKIFYCLRQKNAEPFLGIECVNMCVYVCVCVCVYMNSKN